MKLILVAVLLGTIIGCAPEPDSPSDESLAGTWRSAAHLYALSAIRMQIVQEPNGVVSGKWFAHGDGGPPCASEAPCEASGDIIGINTVSQVTIQLLGGAKFQGALVSNDELRGVFIVNTRMDTISFTRD